MAAKPSTVGGVYLGWRGRLQSEPVACTGTMIVANNNTFSGGTNVNGGTLQVGIGTAAGTLGTGPISIATGPATLSFLRSDQPYTIPNSISGSGVLSLLGTGVSVQSSYQFTLNNSGFTGTAFISNSRLQGNASNIGSPSMITIVDNGTDGGQIYLPGVSFTLPVTIAGIGWQETAGRLGALRLEGTTFLIQFGYARRQCPHRIVHNQHQHDLRNDRGCLSTGILVRQRQRQPRT